MDSLFTLENGILFFLSLFAGFVDAIVGGGGLIQFPGLSVLHPNLSIPTVFGTNKIAGFSGTFLATLRYGKRIKFQWKLVAFISFFAALFAFIGAKCVQFVDKQTLEPVMLFLLIVIAIYTFTKKDFGVANTIEIPERKKYIYGCFIGILVGFYDGFFGPGTGSFLVLGFVSLLSFDFLHASAYAKLINCVTNIASLYVFIKNGDFVLYLALIMLTANMAGSLVGTNMALKKGNHFIKKFFLFVVVVLVFKYAHTIFYK
jgi:uncharacterized protein